MAQIAIAWELSKDGEFMARWQTGTLSYFVLRSRRCARGRHDEPGEPQGPPG